MKPYKAIIIDGKKVIRGFFRFGIMAVVTSLVLVNIKIANVNFGDGLIDGERIISESLPVMKSDSGTRIGEELRAMTKKALCFFLTFDFSDERTIVFGEIPIVRVVSGGYLARTANDSAVSVYNPRNADVGQGEPEPKASQGGTYPIKEVDSSQAKALGEKSGKILIRNETTYGLNIDEMLSSPLTFDMKGSEPKILIVHTHGTEGYSPEGEASYDTSKSDRTLDKEKNVVRVGEAMKQIFEEKGISVIHDTTLHDHPDFNGSYENSRKTIESYLAKNPSISVVLDVHRDAFIYDDGSKAKFVSVINGVKSAQLMFVVGSNGGGLDHPNWRENMKFAIKLQNHINGKYPTLMRGVNLRTERFNGHMTKGSLIIEVGSSGNTLEEAMNGAKYGAEAIAEYLNKLK